MIENNPVALINAEIESVKGDIAVLESQNVEGEAKQRLRMNHAVLVAFQEKYTALAAAEAVAHIAVRGLNHGHRASKGSAATDPS